MGRKEQREARKNHGDSAQALLKIMRRYMPDLWKQIDEIDDPSAYIQNIGLMCGIRNLKEIPHLVTVNNYLSRLEPENLEKIRSKMIYDLIRCRAFEKARYRRKWLVIMDGTRLCSFKKENDEHCLHVTHRNRETNEESTTWYHTVLEAKSYWGMI